MTFLNVSPTPVVQLNSSLFDNKEVNVFVKRDDLTHPLVSGNKFRKLKYALNDFSNRNVKRVLTFGGAFSNHIHAFAYAGKLAGIQTIGIIRGEELLNKPLNDTLLFAKSCGMRLIFVSREEYSLRNNSDYLKDLSQKYFCEIVPEGGTQKFAKQGLVELVQEINMQIPGVSHLCCACGTGGTIAGVVAGLDPSQKAIGVLAVAGIEADVVTKIQNFSENKNYYIEPNSHWGGYAKTKPELLEFIKNFKQEHGILLEQVYTGKLFYDIMNKIKNDFFQKNSQICIIHTGGLQGLDLRLKGIM